MLDLMPWGKTHQHKEQNQFRRAIHLPFTPIIEKLSAIQPGAQQKVLKSPQSTGFSGVRIISNSFQAKQNETKQK